MNRRLFWKLCMGVALGSVALFWVIARLSGQAQEQMSFIDAEHQHTLRQYAQQAEALYQLGDAQALQDWLRSLQQQEQTWAAIVEPHLHALAGSELSERFLSEFSLGRDPSWKIHLYFQDNPIMDVPFADGQRRFLIQLPQRMRPGHYWYPARLLLELVLPLVLLVIGCLLLYRHLMQPLNRLEQATRRFSEGDYDARAGVLLGSRRDELAGLAETFDAMAERIGGLIIDQRQRLAEMSHELRTPLARIEMAVSLAEQGADSATLLPRIRQDCSAMRCLVEDSLTLSWLETERPRLRDETLDLIDLLDSILDDARFEFPDRHIDTQLPTEAELVGSCHRALGQAIENIVRNALDHTPPGASVRIQLRTEPQAYRLEIIDQGPGVPEEWLERIFLPFERLSEDRAGYGLGLALAQRQVSAIGGRLSARNDEEGGLCMGIWLPREGSAA
ncbi:histidine kinase sensor domain-containing protein [Stutzerimonas stutzeri]|uniref:sensor histidine kinase n=1 Tax=Stutzerimonas stutzeri TaxID=316 RepID=UPI00071897D1|nr:histidine kinase [Pseudomonas sp. TTU2014-105ASC]MDH2241640.1 sensor histidine kinase [Pseudomonas sp. GD03909]